MFPKHQELSEQLLNWWRAQTEFKTKKSLATLLKVHPDTLGDYFAGRKFPRADIADRLFELTNIEYLKPKIDVAITPPDLLKEEHGLAEGTKAIKEQPSEHLHQKGDRYSERSVVISFQRTVCPFCSNEITAFRNCPFCGQHFVWASVPLEEGQTKQ
jgi:hypothetical protein